jgi:methionine sulfoxide reductase heme-binding subunit
MPWARALVHLLCLAPLGRLIWLGTQAGLTANPVEFVTHRTGDWALNLLVATLCLTPLARLTGDRRFIQFRRAVGLYSYLYACLHFTTWLWLDKEFDLGEMLSDVGKRRFITVGFTALVLMTPLAITSTNGWIRRLGKRWGKLHQLIYPAAVLAGVHYFWLVKKDIRWPSAYLAAIAALLGWRAWDRWSKKHYNAPSQSALDNTNVKN